MWRVLQEVFRATAIKALSERLTQTIASANEQVARDTDQLFEEQAELGRRKQELDRGLQEAQVRSPSWQHVYLKNHSSLLKLATLRSSSNSKAYQHHVQCAIIRSTAQMFLTSERGVFVSGRKVCPGILCPAALRQEGGIGTLDSRK